MKTLILCSVLLFTLQGVKAQIHLLEDAYQFKSKDALEEYFQQWRSDIPPITNDELVKLSDLYQEAYSVFSVFYNPIDLALIGKSEWGDSIYHNSEYLVVQNSLNIRVQDKVFYTRTEMDSINKEIISEHGQRGLDSLIFLNNFYGENWYIKKRFKNNELHTDTLTNFRPNIVFEGKDILYLSPVHDIILTTFLGSRIQKGKGRISNVRYLSNREVEKRRTFLEKKLKVWRGHWGAYWLLISFPEVTSIVFDREMKYAKIFYKLIYQGGEAYLMNDDGKWKMISAQLTWIE